MAVTPNLGLTLLGGSLRQPEVPIDANMQIIDAALSGLPTSGVGLSSGLVSRWRFDEPSGIRYDSVGANHLTDNGTVTQGVGKIGNSALFTAANSEWLQALDNASLDFTTAFSLSLWVKQTTLVVGHAFAAKWDYQLQGSWALQSAVATDEIRASIPASLTEAVGVNFGETTDADLASGTWYHIVMVYDGTQATNALRLKLYINATLKTLAFTGTIPAGLQNSTADLKFGKWGGTLTNYLNGQLDAVRLYSRAITAAEVTSLYAAGVGVE